MIIWINGGFGAGKTTLARELHRRLPHAVVYDPEDVGLTLWKWLPPDGDFQHLPSWRELVVATALSPIHVAPMQAATGLKTGCPDWASRGMIAVMDRDQITAEVAARLVAGQFPQWAGLPVVPVGLGGWDNITFRLGTELSVRLPSGQDYAAQVAKEHRWLPVLAGQLPLPVPEPVALGQPAAGFPWPWSVMAWTFFPAQAAAVFRRRLPADEATWARARGWALWKALITLGGKHGGDGGQAEARRFGWRYRPHQVISRIIADHGTA